MSHFTAQPPMPPWPPQAPTHKRLIGEGVRGRLERDEEAAGWCRGVEWGGVEWQPPFDFLLSFAKTDLSALLGFLLLLLATGRKLSKSRLVSLHPAGYSLGMCPPLPPPPLPPLPPEPPNRHPLASQHPAKARSADK